MTAKTKAKIIRAPLEIFIAVAMALFIAELLQMIGVTFAHAQNVQGPTIMPQLNTDFFVGQVSGFYPTIQSAVTQQCAATGAGSRVVIPAGSPADGTSGYTVSAVTGGCGKVAIEDRRAIPAANYKWVSTAYVLQSTGANPHTPAKSVQFANPGVNGLDSDSNILVDPTIHQSQIVGQGSRMMAVTNPIGCGFFTATDCINNTFTDKRNSQQEMFRESVFGGPGGMNYGNGPGVTGNLWTTSQPNYWTFHFNRRGITQYQSANVVKMAPGDFSVLYTNQIYGVGGLTGASDEGGVGSKINGGEWNGYYTGTATSGAATGSTTLPISAGSQTCDGCFLYDASKPGPSGHFTGAPTQVALGTTTYYSEPIDTPVTPSTAYAVPACDLHQLTDQTVPLTETCVVTGALGSSGVFTNGIASLSGSYAEQVSITVSAPSGGSQTVFITHRNPHTWGHFILWQGGTAQGKVQVLPATTAVAGIPYGDTVFGAPDSTHLAASIALGGGETAPDTNWVAPVTFGAVTKSGSIATAQLNNTSVLYTPFNNLASAVISGTTGCTGGSMNGTATAVKVSFSANTISWTDASSSTGCTGGGFIQLPATTFAYQLYPYAEQIAAGDVSTSVALEPNAVPFASGDSLVQPHPPTFGFNDRWDSTTIYNPTPHAQNNGILHLFNGAGINLSFNPFRYFNINPCNLYAGCGGSVTAPLWILLQGPNYGTIQSTLPIDPNRWVMNFDCMLGYNTSPGTPGNCTDNEPVLGLPLGNIQLDGVTGWKFAGAGLSTTGNLFVSGTTSTAGMTTKYLQTVNLISDALPPITVKEQFDNTSCKGIQFGTMDSYPATGLTPTGRICSGHDFSSNWYMNINAGWNNQLALRLWLDGSNVEHASFVGDVATPAVTTQSASVLASTTTNDLAYFDNNTGHLADSGVLKGALVLLNAANQFGNFTQTFGTTGSGQVQMSNTGLSGINPSLATTYSLNNSTGLGQFAAIGTNTNCSSAAAPAVCGSAASGSVVIATGATTVVVNTTAVTANSQIQITPDTSLGTKLGVTCNSTGSVALAGFGVTARVAGTSFTLSTLGTVATNPACYSYSIIN